MTFYQDLFGICLIHLDVKFGLYYTRIVTECLHTQVTLVVETPPKQRPSEIFQSLSQIWSRFQAPLRVQGVYTIGENEAYFWRFFARESKTISNLKWAAPGERCLPTIAFTSLSHRGTNMLYGVAVNRWMANYKKFYEPEFAKWQWFYPITGAQIGKHQFAFWE